MILVGSSEQVMIKGIFLCDSPPRLQVPGNMSVSMVGWLLLFPVSRPIILDDW